MKVGQSLLDFHSQQESDKVTGIKGHIKKNRSEKDIFV